MQIKLYRGLKADEFHPLTPALAEKIDSSWSKILSRRAKGDFAHPEDLASEILELSKLIRLQRQHFTDDAEIARRYARENEGVLVEISVETKEISKNFTIEFQNFSKRRTKFEIVYVVDAKTLARNSKKWKLKVRSMRS